MLKEENKEEQNTEDNKNEDVKTEFKKYIKDSIDSQKKSLYNEIKQEIQADFSVHTKHRNTGRYDDVELGKGKMFAKALPVLLKSYHRNNSFEGAYKHFKDNDKDFYQKFLGEQNTNQGGDTVIPRPLWGDVIPALYKRLAVVQLGARQVDLPSGRLDMGRQNAKPTAYYVDEGATITPSNNKFERLSLQAKKLTALSPISGEFLRRDAIIGQDYIMKDLMRAAAQRMDEAFLRGAGSGSDEPLGIYSQVASANKFDTATGASPSLDDLLGDLDKAELKVLDGNHQGPFKFLMSDRTFIMFREERDADGHKIFPSMSDANPTLRGYPVLRTNNIKVDADDSGAANDDEARIYFGDFDSIVIGVAQGAMLDTSMHSQFAKDLIDVRLIMEHDLILRYDDAIAVVSENLSDPA